MLMLIDSAGLWYRAYYALPSSIKAPDGRRAGAVRGFLDALATLVREYSPERLVCCLEGNWRPEWRVELVDSYKTDRTAEGGAEDTPEGLDDQVEAVEQILAAWGMPTATHPRYEADDVIATLAARSEEETAVVTGDRDLFQLVDDGRKTSVVYLLRGISQAKRFRAADVEEKFGVRPSRYADFAVLRGDSSDGLPGVKGIGDKTAAALVERYPSLEAIVEAAGKDELKGRQNANVLAAADYLPRAAEVTRCVRDVDVPDLHAAVPAVPKDEAEVDRLAAVWGQQGAVGRLKEALQS
ncbi:5'-3' exonuclease [Salininema proteolyticum]|uniref:5'-3' exonuclease n=1 Tax=Salininema proteolyticum TaxID=1607685 RepID=A0ABV8U432_9ACTN